MSGASLFYRVTAASMVPLVLPSHRPLRLLRRTRSRKVSPNQPPNPLPPTPPLVASQAGSHPEAELEQRKTLLTATFQIGSSGLLLIAR